MALPSLLPAHTVTTTPIDLQCSLHTHLTGHTGDDHRVESIGLHKSMSPRTPSSIITGTESQRTPYTPLSERSFASSFTSPAQRETLYSDALKSFPHQHRAPFHGSNNQKAYINKTKHMSLADQINNWRTRAQLNGIKVAFDASKCDKLREETLSSASGKENQNQLPIARHKIPTCFSTPSPKRNRESIYARGAYTVPTRLRPFESVESPIVGRPYSSPTSPLVVDSVRKQTLLSPLTTLVGLSGTPGSPFPLSLFSAASIDVPSPASVYQPVLIPSAPHATDPDFKSSCTVCDKQPSESFRMIVLSPCSHILCSSCFTGTLNIVGEKNMTCMECNAPVQSFHFALSLEKSDSSHDSSCPSPYSKPLNSHCELVSKLAELTASTKIIPRKLAASAPNPRPITIAERDLKTDSDVSVLRLDNIPWDVTPSVLKDFFKLPLYSIHTLLDLKGKTLSHAFVRLASSDARIALRSTQNAILGKGRRARAVTVTLASLDELLMAIYPHWRGTFRNGVPSLNGLDTERVRDALSHGLISKEELNALRELILNPNSPFLKVSRLPFSSLINILVTFPSDVDSQMFWNSEIRVMLYDVATVAVKIAYERTLESSTGLDLLLELRDAVTNCRIFTDLQKLILLQIIQDSVRRDQQLDV